MAASDDAEALGGTTAPLKGIRRAAARQMVRAWEAPQFSLRVSVDMTHLLGERPAGVTVTDALVGAVATTLVRHPAVNSWFSEDGVTSFSRAHVGLAVATDAGLVVPVIRDADRIDAAGIAQTRRELVEKARNRRLSLEDMSGATFTISNLGMMGVDGFTAIVNPPQVAILAVGTTRHRHLDVDGEPQWRPVAEISLSCDHRALDGATAAVFLTDLRDRLEGRSDRG